MRRLHVFTGENGIPMHSAAKALGVGHLDVRLFVAASSKRDVLHHVYEAGIHHGPAELWSKTTCNQVKAMCDVPGLLDTDGDMLAIARDFATSPIVRWLPGDRSWTTIGRIRPASGAAYEVTLASDSGCVRRTLTIEFAEDVPESEVLCMIECAHLGIAFGRTGYVNGRIVTRVEGP